MGFVENSGFELSKSALVHPTSSPNRYYQVQTRASSQEFHDNPQLVAPQEACLVLCDERTGTCRQDRDLLLNFLDVIFTRFKVDLEKNDNVSWAHDHRSSLNIRA